MNFNRASDYHMASDPPGYTICRIEVAKGVIYELWCGKERVMHEGPVDAIDGTARSEAVRKLSEAADRHQRRVAA